MTAWATIVAERLGFTRQEALSVGGCLEGSVFDSSYIENKRTHTTTTETTG